MTALRLILASSILLPHEAMAQAAAVVNSSPSKLAPRMTAVVAPVRTINLAGTTLTGALSLGAGLTLRPPRDFPPKVLPDAPALAASIQALEILPQAVEALGSAQPALDETRVHAGSASGLALVALKRTKTFSSDRQGFQERDAPPLKSLAGAAQLMRQWPTLSLNSALQAHRAGRELEKAITQVLAMKADGGSGDEHDDISPPPAKRRTDRGDAGLKALSAEPTKSKAEPGGEASKPAKNMPRPPRQGDGFKSPWKATATFWGTLKKMMLGNDEVRPFVHKYKKELWLARGLLLVYSAFSTFLSWGMGKIVDLAAEGHELSYGLKLLIASTVGIVLINIIYSLAEWLHMWIWQRLDNKVLKDYRVFLYAHFLALSAGFLGKHKSQKLATRFSDDVAVLIDNNTHIPISWPHYFLEFVFSSAMLFFIDWRLAVGIWLTMPAFAILATIFGNRLETKGEQYSDKRGDMVSHVSDTISNIEMIKIFGGEAAAAAIVAKEVDELTDIGTQEAYISSWYHTLISALGDFATKLFVIILGAFALYFYGKPSVGTITSMQEYAFSIKYAVSGFFETWTNYREGEGATRRVLELVASKPDVVDAPDALELGPIQGDIRFENVRYSYNNKTNVLKDVNLEVKPGQVVAIVGVRGSGKTTIVRLLGRLADPQKGSIFIDGHDLRKIKQASFKRQLGYVPQDSGLLDGTIRKNLLFVKPDATEEEMRAALSAAYADFVFDSETFPDGLNTEIGDKGKRLSGGQKQGIAIARAFLRNPRLLLLDEPTASYDNVSEQRVKAAMSKLMKGRTTILVAHRMTTVQNADRIFVLDKGQIVESGTHEELVALKGKYYALWTAPDHGEPTINRSQR